ncbi:MAG: hypothetical protein K9J06_11760 [Flavobacteriales bacterium]|nr:hypothetical protein [Flavobacteriales bacterium]
MEKQVGISLKGNGKGDGTARYCSVGGQVIGLSIGLTVLISAFPYFLKAQTVSGNETVEASKQTMELMPVRQDVPIVRPLVKPKSANQDARVCTLICGRERTTDLYINGVFIRNVDFLLFLSTEFLYFPSLGGTPARLEGRKGQAEELVGF